MKKEISGEKTALLFTVIGILLLTIGTIFSFIFQVGVGANIGANLLAMIGTFMTFISLLIYMRLKKVREQTSKKK